MDDFPEFMKRRANRISKESQHTEDIEGYVLNGADGSQMAFWTCHQDRNSKEHTHDFDEYLVVVHGKYTVIIDGMEKPLLTGDEFHIPKGIPHSGKATAGARTIHFFGGKRI
ncbi:MAG: cupin domain-containing protein [Nitrospinae bacterium]|nr:cupin domain-containing protein [Nitrospinota bacterium]